MSKWRTADHFVSWLRLCTDNRVTSDKIIGKDRQLSLAMVCLLFLAPMSLVYFKNLARHLKEATMPAARTDPYLVSNFLVQIPGIRTTSFCEVSGLEAEVEVVDYRCGDDKPDSVRKLVGLNRVCQVTLKRGLTDDLSLWQWMNTAIQGNATRQNVTIVQLDQAHNPVVQWKLLNAWPCKYIGPALNAQSSDVAIETLVLCYETLQRA
jgi:phage tail-like protein